MDYEGGPVGSKESGAPFVVGVTEVPVIPAARELDVDTTKTKVYTGYCEDRELHIKKGDYIRIPKGTVLRSFLPGRKGPWKAGKTYIVRVHHIICGRTIIVGHRWPRRDDPVYTGHTESDLLHYCRHLGINIGPRIGGYSAAIEELYTHCYERQSNLNPNIVDLCIDLEPPTVNWAGSGGYWTWADINDVQKM